jgi:hypothetical protein
MVQRTAVMTRVIQALAGAELDELSDRNLVERFSTNRDHAAPSR